MKSNRKEEDIAAEKGGDTSAQQNAPRYPDAAALAGAAGKLEYAMSWAEMRLLAYADRPKKILARQEP